MKKIEGYNFWVSHDVANSQDEIDVFTRCVLEDQYGMRDRKIIDFIPKVIFDCGSHIGAFSYLAKSMWPDALIIMIEPHSDSMELAQKNLMEISGNNVVFVEGGIWYNEKQPKYFLKNDFTKASSKLVLEEDRYDIFMNGVYEEQNPDDLYVYKENNTNLYTIEGLMEYFNIDHIDLLKLDIQCAEYDLFENTTLTSDDINIIVGELHNRYTTSTSDNANIKGNEFSSNIELFNKTFSKHHVFNRGHLLGNESGSAASSSEEYKWIFSAKKMKE